MSVKHKEVFGINESLAKEILDVALSTGGDFAEVFIENTRNDSIEMRLDKISKVNISKVTGAALRIIKGNTEVNCSLTAYSKEELLVAAKTLADSFSGTKHKEVEPFVEKNVELVVHPLRVRGNNLNEEIDLLSKANKGAKDYSDEVVQVVSTIAKKEQEIFVFASDSTWQTDYRCNNRIATQVVGNDGTSMQPGFGSFGRNQGMEMYDGFDAYAFGKNVAKDTIEMLHADEMQGGEMPVVIHNGFGGVILHEACVHGLEATSVAKGMSVFCGKIGTKVASDIVNAVDDGTNLNAWGSINVDDEGTPSKCNVLIENGILKNYLIDSFNGRRMHMEGNGATRRESYQFEPTSRMSNTFLLPGKETPEEIIAETEYGLYAKSLGGGSVNPTTGDFNFAVTEGYLIENGKVTRPVKGATLIGNGADILMKIDRIGNDLERAQGMCGSASGSIPVDVGQPTIRVQDITVGGRGGKQ